MEFDRNHDYLTRLMTLHLKGEHVEQDRARYHEAWQNDGWEIAQEFRLHSDDLDKKELLFIMKRPLSKL